MKEEMKTVISTKEGKIILIRAMYAHTKQIKYFAVYRGKRIAITQARYEEGMKLAA